MSKDAEKNEEAGKERAKLEETLTQTDGASGLPMGDTSNANSNEEAMLDEEALLLNGTVDPTMDLIERSHYSLNDEINKNRTAIDEVKAGIKSLQDELSSMSLSVSAILTHIQSSSPRPVPSKSPSTSSLNTARKPVTPRSQFVGRDPIPRASPSTSRDRSRSPLTSRVGLVSKPLNITQTVLCSFCQSRLHYSRNCTVIKSLSTRLSLMIPNQCHKCFRDTSVHPAKCEPYPCRRGCVNEDGKIERHMDWFCPRNPDLTE